jgi:hypothetical protein
MKRLFLILAMAAVTISGMAQKHEIGAVVGGLNGLSYKYWISANTAVQADLAVGLTAAPMSVYYNGTNITPTLNPYGNPTMTNSQYDFTLNPNILYHFPMTEHLKLYIGGGANLGLVSDLANTNPNSILGKFGLNAACGMAVKFNKIVLAFDFRPGYGLGFKDSNAPTFHFFDWKVGLAVRYCL